MNNTKFEPLSITQIFDYAYTIYKNNLRLVLIVSMIISSISLALSTVQQAVTPADVNSPEFMITTLVFALLTLVVGSSSSLVLTPAVFAAINSRPFGRKNALAAVRVGTLCKYVATVVLYVLILIPLFIPVVVLLTLSTLTGNPLFAVLAFASTLMVLYVMVSLMFYVNIVAYGEFWGLKALALSRELLKKGKPTTLSSGVKIKPLNPMKKAVQIMLIMLVSFLMFSQIASFVLSPFGAVGLIVNFILFSFLESFFVIAITVYFFNKYYAYVIIASLENLSDELTMRRAYRLGNPFGDIEEDDDEDEEGDDHDSIS